MQEALLGPRAWPASGIHGSASSNSSMLRTWEFMAVSGLTHLQHASLQDALLDAGWGTVTIHPIIIGNAGTVTC